METQCMFVWMSNNGQLCYSIVVTVLSVLKYNEWVGQCVVVDINIITKRNAVSSSSYTAVTITNAKTKQFHLNGFLKGKYGYFVAFCCFIKTTTVKLYFKHGFRSRTRLNFPKWYRIRHLGSKRKLWTKVHCSLWLLWILNCLFGTIYTKPFNRFAIGYFARKNDLESLSMN